MKVFRKIRETLFYNSKYRRYLGYAFGEIILVIIGILIALSVDNRKEQRLHEEKVNRILVEVQRDIIQNIEATESEIQIFVLRDYIKNLLFNDLLDKNKLKSAGEIFEFLPHIFFLPGTQTTRNIGYDQFVKKIEGLTDKYTNLVKELNLLNRSYLIFMEEISGYNEVVDELRNYTYDHTDWYAIDKFSGYLSEEAFEFLTSNKRYKDYIMKQSDVTVLEITALFDYRKQAIKVYIELQELLGESSLELPNSIRQTTLKDTSSYEKFIGRYEFISGPKVMCNNLLYIFNSDRDLYAVCGSDTTKLSYGLADEGIFGYDEGYQRIFVFDKYTTLIPIAKSLLGPTLENEEITHDLTIVDGVTDATLYRKINLSSE